MDKKEFIGNLKEIPPDVLINNDEDGAIQNFFLILGLIFNDLKSLIFFQKLIEDNYRIPNQNEISSHSGEYAGVITHINRLLIATTGEFFIFIDKNKSVLGSFKFLSLLKKLDKKKKHEWALLIDFNNTSSVLSKIAQVRSNVASHYDHSSTQLRKGFIRSFSGEGKDLIQHKRAYYDLGDTMEHTRFYYSDAAAGEYVNSLIGVQDQREIRKAIDSMNSLIHGLLRVYIESISKSS